MLDPEFKTALLKALRSKKYRQGYGALRQIVGDHEEYCCLGVICDLAASRGLVSWKKANYPPEMFAAAQIYAVGESTGRKTDSETAILPYLLYQDLGLTGPSGRLPVRNGQLLQDFPGLKRYDVGDFIANFPDDTASLVDLNDSGVPFRTIARIIEKYF